MLKKFQLFLVALSTAFLFACGATSTDSIVFPKLSSVTVAGIAVNTTVPMSVKQGQTVMVTMSKGVLRSSTFAATSTLNGATTPTVLGNLSANSTTWSADINSAVGAVMTITVTEKETSARLETLTFNILSP
jgi:hypothetical protein